MGPPPRSFAADAHDCIMVRVLGPTGYKVVARLIAPERGLPSDRHPDRHQPCCRARSCQGVAWQRRSLSERVGATANLDSFCARQRQARCRSGRRNGLSDRTKKLTKEKDAPTCRLLKRLLDKAHTRKPREVWKGRASDAMGI